MQTEKEHIVSEINIVPFVDIVLVILIIFLIVAPTFIKPDIDITLPKAETSKKSQNIKALLTVDIEGKIYFNRNSVNDVDLDQKLKQMVKKDPMAKVVIAADINVAHGNVIRLIDLVKKAGVKKFALSVESEK